MSACSPITGELPRVGIVGAVGRYGRWVDAFFREHGLAGDSAGHDPASPTSWSVEALSDWSAHTVREGGSIAAGMDDDFVLLDRDTLALHWTMARGRHWA